MSDPVQRAGDVPPAGHGDHLRRRARGFSVRVGGLLRRTFRHIAACRSGRFRDLGRRRDCAIRHCCGGSFVPGQDPKRRRSIARIEPPSDSHRAIGSAGMGTSHLLMQPQRHQSVGGRLGVAHAVSTVALQTIFTVPPRVVSDPLSRGMHPPRRCGYTMKCQPAAAVVGGGTTSTGRRACWTTPWETEPSTNDLKAESPRAPVTIRAASRASANVRIAREVPS